MKKKIFNLLLVVLFLPCMLFVNGCGKADNDDSEQLELVTNYYEMNDILASLKGKRANLTQFKVEGKKVVESVYTDASKNSTVTTILKGSADAINNQYVLKAIYDDGDYSVDHVKKVDDSYVKYTYSEYTSDGEKNEWRNVKYVGEDYIRNSLFWYDGVGVNINNLDLNDYDSLVESYKALNKENLVILVQYYDFYFDLNPKVNLFKNDDGDYLLEYKVDTDYFESEGLNRVVIESSILFDENSIISNKTSYKLVYYDLHESSCYMEMNYFSGVDNSLLITDFSEFSSYIYSDSEPIHYVIDGYYVDEDWVYYEKDEAFEVGYENVADNTTIEWYLDSAYTKSIDLIEESTSTELVLYGKTVPDGGYGLVIEQFFVKDSDGIIRRSDVKWIAVAENEHYEFLTKIRANGNCMGDVCSYYEGDVISTKVNGNVTNGSSLLIENKKIYNVRQEANENSSSYERKTYGLYYYQDGAKLFIIGIYDEENNLKKFEYVKTYDNIVSCPSEYDNAIDLTYPGVSYACEIIDGDKTKITFSATGESVEAGYEYDYDNDFVYSEFLIFLSYFDTEYLAMSWVSENVQASREYGGFEGEGYYIFNGSIIDE